MLAVHRWIRVVERFNPGQPRAPRGTGIGGQWVAGAAGRFIRGLLGADGPEEGKPDVRRSTGRFRAAGGSTVSVRLPSRRPRVDDEVRDPRTGRIGTVQTMSPDGTGRVAWQDGRVETRKLSELEDPQAPGVRQLQDPARSFDAEQGEPVRMDTAVERGGTVDPTVRAQVAEDVRQFADMMAGRGGFDERELGTAPELAEVASGLRDGSMSDSEASRRLSVLADGFAQADLERDGRTSVSTVNLRQWSERLAPAPRRRTAAERMRDAIASGAVVGRDRERALDVARRPRPRLTSAEVDDRLRDALDGEAPKAPEPAGTVRAEGYSPAANTRLRVVADGKGGYIGQRWGRGSGEWHDDPFLGTGNTPRDVTSRMPRGQWTMVAPPKVSGPAKKSAARKMAPPKATPDVKAIAGRMGSASSREEADAQLEGLTGPQLKAVARETGTSLIGASTKAAMRRQIVEHTVGFRLNSQTIRGGSWDNPTMPAGSPVPAPRSAAERMGGARPRGGSANPAEARERLLSATSEDEAWAYLDSLELNPTQMRRLAADLGVRGQGRAPREQVQHRIVQTLVGSRMTAGVLSDVGIISGGQATGSSAPGGISVPAARMTGARRRGATGSFDVDHTAAQVTRHGSDDQAEAERISKLATENDVYAALVDMRVPDLKRLARELNIGDGFDLVDLPGRSQVAQPRKLTPEERRRHIAQAVIRDRGRFTWR